VTPVAAAAVAVILGAFAHGVLVGYLLLAATQAKANSGSSVRPFPSTGSGSAPSTRVSRVA
jgi:hypothetical protein